MEYPPAGTLWTRLCLQEYAGVTAWIPTEGCSSPGWSKDGGKTRKQGKQGNKETRKQGCPQKPRALGNGVAWERSEPAGRAHGPRQRSARSSLVFQLLIELIELLQFAGVNPPLATTGGQDLELVWSCRAPVRDVFHNKGEMENVVAPGPLRVSL